MGKEITKRSKDYSKWYNDIVLRARMADYSAVKGCMVIRPNGYAVWENMQAVLNKMFKDTGHTNAYFPLLIPKSFLSKEAAHVAGFAKECAVVTHYRLKNDPNGNGIIVDPDAKLEEELIIRPTSETIIWNSYKNWIQSYRDLPIKINQWANVVRWEMRTRLFLRTTEFLWQEGHTAHASEKEAIEEARTMLDVYVEFAEKWMAVPVLKGIKSESERFAGAVETYCIEGLMQDGKSLQMGTSHFLGQNFAKAFDVKYSDKDGKQEYVWATSWGVSTRLIGALIMAHSDDNGLILPPKLAPLQCVIVPIYKTEEEAAKVGEQAEKLVNELEAADISVKYDSDDNHKPGWKFAEYEMLGVPIRMAIGPRDLENGTVEVARRDTGEKLSMPLENLAGKLLTLLEEIQDNIYKKALTYRDDHITEVTDYESFKQVIKEKTGFVLAYWDGSVETEEKIKNETKATIRCIPEDAKQKPGKCVYTGNDAKHQAYFAKAY